MIDIVHSAGVLFCWAQLFLRATQLIVAGANIFIDNVFTVVYDKEKIKAKEGWKAAEVIMMLYVADVQQSSLFWIKYFDFKETYRAEIKGEPTIKISSKSGFSLQFFQKEFILKVSPEVSLETPSLLWVRYDLHH